MQPGTDGAMWTLEINAANLASGTVGAVTNHDMVITLKGGATLETLGLADTGLDFESVWIKRNGAIAQESISSGFILGNNLLNKSEHTTGFMAGKMGNSIIVDAKGMRVRSIHTFKPNVQFVTSDLRWVVYMKEQIPPELRDYIDVDDVEIYSSDITGEPRNESTQTFKARVDENGLVDTSTVPELSIMHKNDADQLSVARKNIGNILGTVTGQQVSYTISYKIKDGVSFTDFSRALNDYMEQHDARVRFQSWMESDYLDHTGINKDNGAPHKQLAGSYANSYVQANDSDKDGVFDFVEFEYGMDIHNVDTDGDGVPDGQELLDDKTSPVDAADYLVQAPTTGTTVMSPAARTVLEGAMPKPLIADPSDGSKLLSVTSVAAGDAIVQLVRVSKIDGVDRPDMGHVYATVKIPHADLVAGTFSLPVEANAIPQGVDTVALVGMSPNGRHPMLGSVVKVSELRDAYEPQAGTVTVEKGATPGAAEAKQAVANAKDLPADATYSWSRVPATDTAGPVKGVVKVTYADGTFDEVEVAVTVADQASKFEPTGQAVNVAMGAAVPNARDGIANADALPPATSFAWKVAPSTAAAGTTRAVITVSYPDGSAEEVAVDFVVTDGRKDNERYEPQVQPVQATLNGPVPAAESAIANRDALPPTTQFAWVTAPDVSRPGTTTGVIVATYPDGSQDMLTATVRVTDPRTDAEKYAPHGTEVTTMEGVLPPATSGIDNMGELPPTVQVAWKVEPDVTTPGQHPGTIEVAYPDGTTDEVNVTVTVRPKPADPQNAVYDPTAALVRVELGGHAPDAKAAIANAADLPQDAEYLWKTFPSVDTAGEFGGSVVVTYADGTFDVVDVKVTVVDTRTMAEKHTPQGGDVTVEAGGTANAEDGIVNLGELPGGTHATWNPAPDTSRPGDTVGTITVAYPDGSEETIEAPVHVKDPGAGNGDGTGTDTNPDGDGGAADHGDGGNDNGGNDNGGVDDGTGDGDADGGGDDKGDAGDGGAEDDDSKGDAGDGHDGSTDNGGAGTEGDGHGDAADNGDGGTGGAGGAENAGDADGDDGNGHGGNTGTEGSNAGTEGDGSANHGNGSAGNDGGTAGTDNGGNAGAADTRRTVLPQTGDASAIQLASMAFSGLAALAAAFGLKRRRNE